MYKAIVMGVSAGGLPALKTILSGLPSSFPLPIAIVQHRDERADSFLAEYLDRNSKLNVREAEDKEPLHAGKVYIAPAGYHLLIEPDKSFSLSADPRVNYSCPSIDVLFESAVDVYQEMLIGVILTGANSDGAHGLKSIKARGGLAIVQSPDMAEADAMPRAAIAATQVDYVVDLEQIAPLLVQIVNNEEKNYGTNG